MSTEPQIPRWVDRLIEKLAPIEWAEEIHGDLSEMFLVDVKQYGLKTARKKYIARGLGFLFKRFFWKNSPDYSNTSPMFTSYFKMASRSLLARKGTALINILGLVIGIAASLVILTVVRFELSFDTFHSDPNRIYRIVRVSGSDMSEFRTGVSYPVPQALREGIPSIKSITALEYQGGTTVDVMDATGTSKKMFQEPSGVTLADPSFFTVFDFAELPPRWISGNPETALTEPFSVVLTRSLAKKYFETEQALGQTLKFEKKIDCKVTGVIEDFPLNTDLPFTMLVSYATINYLDGEAMTNWTSVNDSNQAYLLLAPGATKQEVEAQIEKVHAAHTSKELHENRHYLLQELHELHTDAKFGNFSGRTISQQTLLAMILIGVFLLLTAAINYINLATAQSSLRAKEIGLRKVMGSHRNHLLSQFMTETFVIVFLAGVLALGLSEILLVNLQTLLNLKLVGFNFTSPFILLSTLGIILIVTVFAGFYPSLVISRFNPVAAMKNKFATESFAGLNLRKVLVVVQFTITQILVVGTFIVVSQMNFFRHTNMGFNTEAILTTRLGEENLEKRKLIEDQLRSQSFVENVSFSYTLPSGLHRARSYRDIGRLEATAQKDYQIYEYEAIDSSYLKLFGIQLLAGRNLQLSDTTGNILINETLMKNLGWKNPEEALGQPLKDYGRKYTVVGITADFFSNSLKEGIDNIVMLYNPQALRNASIKLNIQNGESLQDLVVRIEKIWKNIYPDHFFNYSFFDENIEAFYRQEQKYAQLFQLFSFTFLLIGCLGLYGLITFVVNRKGKEMAIRKVLGAGTAHILLLFSREYVHLIVISFLFATPIAYYAVDSWLSNFAHHIELQWWNFTLPGAAVLTIALIVVASKSLRTANANPVDRLKEE